MRDPAKNPKSYLFIIQYSYTSVAIHLSELVARKVLIEPGTGTPVPGLKKKGVGHRGAIGATGTLLIFFSC